MIKLLKITAGMFSVKRRSLFFLLSLLIGNICCSQALFQEIPLFEGRPPGTKVQKIEEEKRYDLVVDSLVSRVTVPTISIFRPGKVKQGAPAVIIIPGGGYHTLLIEREGRKIAKTLNEKGITAFVLKYRLPSADYFDDRSIVPLMDLQQAIYLVRKNAAKWAVNPEAIGLMGFSAGGHLALMAGTHYDTSFIPSVPSNHLKPDFLILVNPVVSFSDSTGHRGSRDNLLSKNYTGQIIDFFSGEKNVRKGMPAVFLAHALNDKVVKVENALDLFNALRSEGVAAEIHIYAKGDHGFLENTPPRDEWMGSCLYWMKSMGWLN
jgi:acetyl esterase/lipase